MSWVYQLHFSIKIFMLSTLLFLLCYCFLGLQHAPVIVTRVPESCILICLGLVMGTLSYILNKHYLFENLLLQTDVFFLFILPPIVLEAGYFMPKSAFFGNIGTILTYAFVGTIFNALAVGSSLFGVYYAGLIPG